MYVSAPVLKQTLFLTNKKNAEVKFTFLFGHKNKIIIIKPR